MASFLQSKSIDRQCAQGQLGGFKKLRPSENSLAVSIVEFQVRAPTTSFLAAQHPALEGKE